MSFNRRVPRLLLATTLCVVGWNFAQAHADGPAPAALSYIVQLVEPPATAYTGGIAGLRATQPAAEQGFDIDNPDVQAYIAHLERRQREVLATVGDVPVLHRYTIAINGFAALLTEAQVRQLAATPGVASVKRDRKLRINAAPEAPTAR